MAHLSATTMKRILFLTSVPPHIVDEYVAADDWSNPMLPKCLSEAGALVNIKCWRDQDIIPTIMRSDLVTFLWADDYIRHPLAFETFLIRVKTAFKNLDVGATVPCVMNHIDLVAWNMNKKYLLEMKDAAFDIPRTDFLDPGQYKDAALLHKRLLEIQSSGPLVLKPSVSASAKRTYLIADIAAISDEDVAYLTQTVTGALRCDLVVQEFVPEISAGEYSFIFIGTELSHAVLKLPKSGEFRCQGSYGGQSSRKEIDTIDKRTIACVKSIFDYLVARFSTGSTGEMGYVRIDGIVTGKYPFVLMEVEAIEPELHLRKNGLKEMLSLLLE